MSLNSFIITEERIFGGTINTHGKKFKSKRKHKKLEKRN